jgi:hypothetical protein
MTKEWDSYRDTITYLYMTESRTLKEVMQKMKDDHKFSASSVLPVLPAPTAALQLTQRLSTRAYRSKLKSWGLQKYTKRGDSSGSNLDGTDSGASSPSKDGGSVARLAEPIAAGNTNLQPADPYDQHQKGRNAGRMDHVASQGYVLCYVFRPDP